MEQEKIDLSDLINGIYLLNKGNLNLKNIDFKTNIEPEVAIFADLNTIKTVLRNLMSNAIKFTPDGGEIYINAIDSEENVTIVVKDSGIGIPEENIPKLFDSNQHLTTYGTNRESGSGLGLILCKDFVEKNRGKIWVESLPGKGTSFFVQLPAQVPVSESVLD